jgi:hypothetical protein
MPGNDRQSAGIGQVRIRLDSLLSRCAAAGILTIPRFSQLWIVQVRF